MLNRVKQKGFQIMEYTKDGPNFWIHIHQSKLLNKGVNYL